MSVKRCRLLIAVLALAFCLAVAGALVLGMGRTAAGADGAEDTPITVTEMQLLRNQDMGQNHWLVIYFDRNVVSHTNAEPVNDENVRMHLLINGESTYHWQEDNEITTAVRPVSSTSSITDSAATSNLLCAKTETRTTARRWRPCRRSKARGRAWRL